MNCDDEAAPMRLDDHALPGERIENNVLGCVIG